MFKQIGWVFSLVLLVVLYPRWHFGEETIDITTYAEKLGFRFIGTITGKNATILVKILATDQIRAYSAREGAEPLLGKYKIKDIKEKFIIVTSLDNKVMMVHAEAFAGDPVTIERPLVEAPKTDLYTDSYKEDGFSREKNEVKVTREYWNDQINNKLSSILMQAGTEPVMQDGQVVGFSFFEIDKDSIFAKFGLQDGDIVTEINGRPLGNPAEAIKILQSLKNADDLSIKVQRGNQETTVSVDVK
jgi:type II secretion system protein C